MGSKKLSVSKLKAKLDRIFSEYIRRKAAQDVNNVYVACCSCGQVTHWKDMDAGHFVTRKHNATRYDERNVHAQCRPCNRYDSSNPSGYARYLIDRYGKDILAELDHLGHQVRQFKTAELAEMVESYGLKLKELRARQGV